MQTLIDDVQDIEKKFDQVEQQRSTNGVLSTFIASERTKLNQLRDAFQLAQKSFSECAKYFGETSEQISPEKLFKTVIVFLKNFAKARKEFEENQF